MDRAMQESGFYDTSVPGGKDQVVHAYEAILDEAETYGEILLQMARFVDPFSGIGIPSLETCPLK